MIKKIFMFVMVTSILAAVPPAEAQQPKVYRVGVVLPRATRGTRVIERAPDRDVKELGLEEGKQFVWQSEIRR